MPRIQIVRSTDWVEALPHPGLGPEDILLQKEHGNDVPEVGTSWRPPTGCHEMLLSSPDKKRKNLDQYDDSPDAW